MYSSNVVYTKKVITNDDYYWSFEHTSIISFMNRKEKLCFIEVIMIFVIDWELFMKIRKLFLLHSQKSQILSNGTTADFSAKTWFSAKIYCEICSQTQMLLFNWAERATCFHTNKHRLSQSVVYVPFANHKQATTKRMLWAWPFVANEYVIMSHLNMNFVAIHFIVACLRFAKAAYAEKINDAKRLLKLQKSQRPSSTKSVTIVAADFSQQIIS